MVSIRSSSKELFFVDVSLRLLWFLLLVNFFNWRIYVFDSGKNPSQSALLRKMHNFRWIIRVIEHNSLAFGQSHSNAIKLADKISNSKVNDIPLELVQKLCRSEEVGLVFKRILTQHLSLLTSINQYICRNKEIRNPNLLISGKYSKILQENTNIIDSSITVSYSYPWGNVKLWLNWIIVAMSYLIHLLIQLAYKTNQQKKIYKFGISIHSSWVTKFKGSREFTFLVDDKIIKKDETVFLVEYPENKEFYQKYSSAGYTLKEALNIKGMSYLFRKSTLKFRQDFLKIIKLLVTYKEDFFIYEALTVLLFYRLSWSIVIAQTSFKNYIYFNKEGVSQISTNIFLKQQQIKTHTYSQFIGGPYIVSGNDSIFDKRNVHWSFINPDYYYLNSQAMADSMALHCQKLVKHKVIGNIFSEKILEIKNNPSSIEEMRNQFNINKPEQVISIFDTTYVAIEDIYSNFDEAINFLRDSIQLAKLMPKSTFLFKPSYSNSLLMDMNRNYWFDQKGLDIVSLRHEFNKLPNTVMLDDTIDVVDLISISDIVFTNCFSSPTVDALLADVPAFWYQSTTNVSFSVYNKIPELVVSGYKSLVKQINIAQQDNYLLNFENNADYINLIGDPSKKALMDLRLNLNANS